MVGPKFADIRILQADPWQKLYDAMAQAQEDGNLAKFRIAVSLILTGIPEKSKELVMSFRIAASLAITSFSNPEDFAGQMEQVLGKVGKTVTQQEEKKDDGFYEEKKSSTVISQKSLKDNVHDFLYNYGVVLNLTDPTRLHTNGKSDEGTVPAPLGQAQTDFTNMVTEFGSEKTIAEIKKQIKSTQDLESPYVKAMLSAFDRGLEGFNSSLAQLTRTQRAVDGLTMLMKARLFGQELPKGEMPYYFQGILSDDEISSLMRSVKKGGAGFRNGMELVFGRLKEHGHLEFVNIALEANFGENAGILSQLMESMEGKEGWETIKRTSGIGTDAFSIAEYFFGYLDAEKENVSSAWDKFSTRYSGTASKLLSDWVAVPPNSEQAAIRRDRYDIATVLSVLDSFKNGLVGYREFGEDRLIALLSYASGTGNMLRPTPVACTFFLNSATLISGYNNFRKSPEDFDALALFLANGLTAIYNQPFGTFYPSGRQDKADYFMQEMNKTINKPELLEDLTRRFLTNTIKQVGGYHHIGFQSPYEQIIIGSGQEDHNALNQILKSYLPRTSTDQTDVYSGYKDLFATYAELEKWMNENPFTPSKLGVDKPYWNRLEKSRQSIIADGNALLGRILSEGKKLAVDHIETDLEYRDTDNTRSTGRGYFSMYTRDGGYWNTRLSKQTNGYYDGSGNFISNEAANLQLTSQMNSIGQGGWEIYDAFANYVNRNESQFTESGLESMKVKDEQLLLQLNGRYPLGGMELYYVRNATETDKFRNLGAFVSVGKSWYHFEHLEKLMGGDDLQKMLSYTTNYGEAMQRAGVVATYGAFETLDVYAAGVLGVANLQGDTRFAALFGKSLEGDYSSAFTLGTDMSSKKPVLWTAGLTYFNKRDLEQREGKELEDIRKNAYDQQDRLRYDIADPKVVATGRVLGKTFEAITTFGSDWGKGAFVGGRLSNSNASIGGILHFQDGVDFYRADGRYVHQNFAGSLVVEGYNGKVYYANGILTIKLGSGKELAITGVYGNVNNFRPEQFEALSDSIDALSKAMEEDFNEAAWNTLGESQRKEKLRAIGQNIRQIFSRVEDSFSVADAFGDVKNEASVSYTDYNSGFSTKLSYTRVNFNDSKGENLTAGFITNISSINLTRDGSKRLDLTIGMPVAIDGQTGPIQSLAGAKLNLDGIAFGVVGYNLLRGDAVVESTIAANVFEDWLGSFTAKHLSGAGKSFELFLGNKKYMADYEFTKLKGGMYKHELDLTVGLGTLGAGGFYNWYAGVGGQYTYAPGFIGKGLRANLTYYAPGGKLSLRGDVFFTQDMHDGSLRTFFTDKGVKVTGTYYFR